MKVHLFLKASIYFWFMLLKLIMLSDHSLIISECTIIHIVDGLKMLPHCRLPYSIYSTLKAFPVEGKGSVHVSIVSANNLTMHLFLDKIKLPL